MQTSESERNIERSQGKVGVIGGAGSTVTQQKERQEVQEG